jgi:membrane-bound lytic murein transglycosylase F
MRSRWLACALLVVAAGVSIHAAPGRLADRYDNSFRKYSKRFFGPGFDWRLFKAQAMAESGLNPAALSAAGAKGVMQLLPSTYADVQSKNTQLGAIDDPDCNIAAGIYHDRQLWNQWATSSEAHRDRFTLGSYNAGLVTVQTAQRIAHDRELDERIWPSIEAVAPAVPRWRYAETFNYLSRITANLAALDQDGRLK